jgi:hypothetical protein
MSLDYRYDNSKAAFDQPKLRGLDPRLSITLFIGDAEHTVLFQTRNQRSIFKTLYSNRERTVSPEELFEEAGTSFKEFHLSDKISRINKAIAHLNLRIINQYGKGYRLVEETEMRRIFSVIPRTLVLEDGTEVTIESTELMFNILEYIAKYNGVTARNISNEFKLDKPATAQAYISKLRSQLRSQNLNIALSYNKDGLKVYKLVPLEM